LHIITTSSLNHIKSFYKSGDFAVERFRPNLVINSYESGGFIENEWIGKEIKIGDELIIKIIEPSPRCVFITLKQGDLRKDNEILKAIVQNSSAKSFTYFPGETLKGVLGVYGIIKKIGQVKIGDKVEIIEK